LTVNNLTVNEGSPYAVFTVTGATDQFVKLTTANGTAGSADYGSALQYFNPDANNGAGAWVDYTAGDYVQIPEGPNHNGTTLLVRATIASDTAADNGETFTLTATNTGGVANVISTGNAGIATIKDDGTGSIFTAANTTGNPDTPTAPLDDDRPLAVSSVTVNEGS
ncbi:hypothetical protein ICN28_09455, partial [Polynucleobacter sp. 30F-ANTBAC]|uniref:hypothetical protein n=1 Tax=Polynucleobacter sp. 30F-ANTBAC TaxID=2689095 RepID=UPI001C0E3925